MHPLRDWTIIGYRFEYHLVISSLHDLENKIALSLATLEMHDTPRTEVGALINEHGDRFWNCAQHYWKGEARRSGLSDLLPHSRGRSRDEDRRRCPVFVGEGESGANAFETCDANGKEGQCRHAGIKETAFSRASWWRFDGLVDGL